MSSTAPSQRKVNPTDVSRILDVVRNTGMSPADPVMRAVEKPVPAEQIEARVDDSAEPTREVSRQRAEPRPEQPRPRRAKTTGVLSEKPFEVAVGQGTTALTVRVSHDLHARLKLIVTRNQIARNGDPKTINAIVTHLIEQGIDIQEAA